MSNCFCCFWPIEFGCEELESDAKLPSDANAPPKNVLCPSCHIRVDPVYKRKTQYFSFCFIPCACCPCGQSPPYLACPECDYHFCSYTFKTCSNCQASMDGGEKFCGNCGVRA